MESQQKPTSALFDVYLRLRPPQVHNQLYTSLTTPERFLTVEKPRNDGKGATPSHITLNPPNDNRRRAVEKFAFTKVFEEEASQLDIFQGTGVVPLVEGVLGPQKTEGRDGLLATLGVTGSGKSHTILGSRSQRGLTQLALDLLFRSLSSTILDTATTVSLHASVAASDPSEAQVLSAQSFLENLYSDPSLPSRASSRAATPMRVRHPDISFHPTSIGLYPKIPGSWPDSLNSRIVRENSPFQLVASAALGSPCMSQTFPRCRGLNNAKSIFKGESVPPPTPRRNGFQRPSVLPQLPDISSVTVQVDPNAEYAVVISMYEVYNDRIFDLLTPASRVASTKDFRRRPLLFKPTEQSPDRKVVAGLRKVICGTMREALMVLEVGLHERRVAGTGSNSVSSRSHGFFCVEVKKRRKGRASSLWTGSALTIVDLAGSERARDAKTQGATLAEAGKINESLMYLGQCLQMQSDLGNSTKPNLVPFRQCKLTELLFSNSFPSSSVTSPSMTAPTHPRNPQKAIMVVTADPVGDFNATSQILRYSALAREVTVPRIPSVTSTILASGTSRSYFSTGREPGRSTPTETERETMEIAALEIARMSEEIDGLRTELAAETQWRMEADAHLLSAQEKMLELEAEIREACFQEMEARMKGEMDRWQASWQGERGRGEEHLDRKLEILARGIEVGDGEDKENAYLHLPRVADGEGESEDELRLENERLRIKVAQLTRAAQARSPSKRSVLEERLDLSIGPAPSPSLSPSRESRLGLEDIGGRMRELRVSRNGSGPAESMPLKKVRKLPARRWDLMDEDDVL